MRFSWLLAIGLTCAIGSSGFTSSCFALDAENVGVADLQSPQAIEAADLQKPQTAEAAHLQEDQTNLVRVNTPDPNLPVKYWGNLFSMKFHRPSCPFAKAMSAHNVVFFNFRRQAVESGQVPCRYCLPPNWTAVHAQVLNPQSLRSTNSDTQATSEYAPKR